MQTQPGGAGAPKPFSSLAVAALVGSITSALVMPVAFFIAISRSADSVASAPSRTSLQVWTVVLLVLPLASLALSAVALGRVLWRKAPGKLAAIPALILSLAGVFSSGFAAFVAALGASGGVGHGRVLRRGARAVRTQVARGDAWVGAPAPSVPEDRAVCAELAARWLADAREEHASIAAFAKVSLDLLALGAPPALLAEAQRAGLDEVRHAQACFALASAYDGRAWSAAALEPAALAPASDRDDEARWARVAREALLDGCLGEGAAAELARRASQAAVDPVVRAALEHIAVDEARHAELGWQALAFCLRARPSLAGALEGALDAATRGLEARAAEPGPYAAHGRFEPGYERAVRGEVAVAVRARFGELCAELGAPGVAHAA